MKKREYKVLLDIADIGILTDILIETSEKTDVVCIKQYYLELITKIQADYKRIQNQ